MPRSIPASPARAGSTICSSPSRPRLPANSKAAVAVSASNGALRKAPSASARSPGIPAASATLRFTIFRLNPRLPAELRADWPHAEFSRNDRAARRLAKTIFNPDARTATLKAFVRATPFQLKVWRALLRIPEGCVASYSRIAQTVGHQKAVRAVGSACGANPLAWLIPCHRVIRETGIVQGYRWGETRKHALLARESAKTSG